MEAELRREEEAKQKLVATVDIAVAADFKLAHYYSNNRNHVMSQLPWLHPIVVYQ